MVANLGFGPTQQDDRELMRMLEARQRQAVPDPAAYAKAMARAQSPEGVALQQRMQAARQQAMKPAVSVAGGSTTPKPEQAGFFSRVARKGMDYLQDPAARARLAAAMNTMRFEPDPNLATALRTRATGIEERRTQAREANRTVDYLRKMGRPDLAGVVEANPALAGEALKAIMGVSTDKFATKGFEPKVDPATGQIYGVQYDPNTGKYIRVDVPGATGETPTQKQARESAAALELQDFESAQEAGVRAFTQAQQADRTIGTMYTAINAIDTGGRSGALDQFLPAFDAATATLRNAATTMGIDIINSATFGALSESELRLALSSGIPLGLEGNELKNFLYKKIEAQTLLRNELLRTAQMLSGGQMKYSDFIKQYKVGGGTKPISVKNVTPEELGR